MMVRAAVLAGVAGLLMGCESLAPVVKTEGQDVSVPVVQKCIERKDLPKKPTFPLDIVDLSNEKEALARLVNAARLEVKARTEYVSKAQEVFDKCSKD